jgi:hypothetical protein
MIRGRFVAAVHRVLIFRTRYVLSLTSDWNGARTDEGVTYRLTRPALTCAAPFGYPDSVLLCALLLCWPKRCQTQMQKSHTLLEATIRPIVAPEAGRCGARTIVMSD